MFDLQGGGYPRVHRAIYKTEKEKQPDIYFLTELYHATYKVFLGKKKSNLNQIKPVDLTGNIQEVQRQRNLLKNYNGNGIRNIQTVENSKGKMT